MSEHGLPWSVKPYPGGTCARRILTDDDRSAYQYAATAHGPAKYAEANAALIVAAVNAHSDLLAACEAALEAISLTRAMSAVDTASRIYGTCEASTPADREWLCDDVLRPAHLTLRDAIARAKGHAESAPRPLPG